MMILMVIVLFWGQVLSQPAVWSEVAEWTTCGSDCFYSGWCDRGRCKCQENFNGDSCESGICLNLCGGGDQGRCSGGYCICREGWSGIDCQTWVGCPNECSGHGDCGLPVEGSTKGECDCDPGYFETDCRSYYQQISGDVQLNPELSWIKVYFPYPMTINGDENCERFITEESIEKLGDEAYCWGGTPQEVWIRIGQNANFTLWDVSDGTAEDFMETEEELGIYQGKSGGVKPPGRASNWVQGSFKIKLNSMFQTYLPTASLQIQSNPVCGSLLMDGTVSDHKTGQHLKYGWHFGGENNPQTSAIAAVVENSESPFIEIESSILTKGTYEVFLTVEDYLGHSSTTSITIRPRFDDWTLSIGGGNFQRPYTHLTFRLDGIVDTPDRCGDAITLNLKYKWTVSKHSSDFTSKTSVIYSSTSPFLLIPPNTLLPYYNYTVTLSVTGDITKQTITFDTHLSPLPPPVHIEFKQRRVVIPYDKDNTFEFYSSSWKLSRSPVPPDMKYYWSCVRTLTNSKCYSNPHILGFNSSSVELPRDTLQQNETFYLSVSMESRYYKSSDRMYLVSRHSSKISPVNSVYIEGGQESQRIVISRKSIFRALSSSSSSLPGTEFAWDIKDGGYGSFASSINILYPRDATLTTLSRDTLIISPNVLLPNYLYNLTFSLEREVVASLAIQTLDVPRNGSCTVTPSYGISYSTHFSIFCHSFISSTSSPSTFRYTYYFHRGSYETLTRFLIHDTSSVQSLHTVLGEGDLNDDYKANVTVTISDLDGSSSTVYLPIQIFPSTTVLNLYLNQTKRESDDSIKSLNEEFEIKQSTTSDGQREVEESEKKYDYLEGLYVNSIGSKDYSKSLSLLSFSADLLNINANSDLDENKRFSVLDSFDTLLGNIETNSPELLTHIPFLILVFDTFRQISENPYVFRYRYSKQAINLLETLIPFYKEALRLYDLETTGSSRDVQVVEEHAELHQSMIDLIGDLISAANNHKIEEGKYLVDDLFYLIGNITEHILDTMVYSSDPVVLWGNRLAMSFQYSPRDFLTRATTLTGDLKPVPKSVVPAIQFSSDILPQVQTQIFLIFSWFQETPYPWSEERVHSSVTEFQILTRNREHVSLRNVSQIRVFAPILNDIPPPSPTFKERCQWWEESTGRWNGRGCTIAGDSICNCKEGTMFSFGYYEPKGASDNSRQGDDWWTDPGMWVAIVVAILATAVGIICMYLIPWRLLRDLRRREMDNTY